MNITNIETLNSTLELKCVDYSDWEKILVEEIEYYVEGVALCTVAIIGLLANIATIFILFKQKSSENTFNSLLICLFLFDAVILLTGILWSFQAYLELFSTAQIILYPILIYPLKNISMTASIFMTVAIAHERYDAIRQPVQYRQMMIDLDVRRKHFMKYILTIVLISLIFNVPKFFEIKIQWIHITESIPRPYHAIDESMLREETNASNVKPVIRATDLRKNSLYLTYYINLATFVVIGLIPFSLISYYNYNVYKGMKLRLKIAEDRQRKISNISIREKSTHERDSANVLGGIVLLFMICHSLRLLLNFYEMIFIKHVLDCITNKQSGFPTWFFITKSFSDLMLIINSSINVIIYGTFHSAARNQISMYKGKILNFLTYTTKTSDICDKTMSD